MKLARGIKVTLLVLLPMMAFSYVWVSSDSIGVYMKNYGELEIWGPVTPGDTVKQIDRISVLVGTEGPEVFDYYEDADVDVASMLVAEPVFGDMEGFTSINNFYSFNPPDVHVAITAYAWNEAEYVIISLLVTNIGTTPLNARIGLDIISQIEGDYDGIHTWLPETNMIDMTREGENHIGLKFLSHPMTSLSQFVWFSDYSASGQDAALWGWMTTTENDTSAICTNPDDGVVSIPSTDPVAIDADASVELFYSVARGQTQEAVVANIAAAESAYQSIFTVGVDDDLVHPDVFALAQNYPNPFNPSTQIHFSIPEAGHATLNVYNVRGELVSTLTDEWLDEGSHSLQLDASNLASGVYVYTLSQNGNHITRKMTLLK